MADPAAIVQHADRQLGMCGSIAGAAARALPLENGDAMPDEERKSDGPHPDDDE